ncbi:hypothetical protein PGTUg99_026431 [Puccinia graminis f. sp. tritici]|uniref:Uncharacterized protein n=1 Tax=Puccinia graminis f. sp. tritici TaxID=56615 RepID=A0A5B0R6I1_PUCGR|nr:hypothetical protein PGTUg99_026431 [Puccinia graminis f. sp. tritici]
MGGLVKLGERDALVESCFEGSQDMLNCTGIPPLKGVQPTPATLGNRLTGFFPAFLHQTLFNLHQQPSDLLPPASDYSHRHSPIKRCSTLGPGGTHSIDLQDSSRHSSIRSGSTQHQQPSDPEGPTQSTYRILTPATCQLQPIPPHAQKQ